MAPRTGRPPSGNARTHVVPIRLTDDESAALKAAAKQAGVPTGQYIRERALAAARRAKRST